MAPDRERSDEELAHTQTAPGSEPRNSDVLPLGDKLGRFRLQREIGRGGMGVVHAAFDPDLERKVALKVLKGNDDDQNRQRLLREARAMARLTHPNVVTVHEVGSVAGRDYIAMELVDGDTLEDWLRGGKRTEREIVSAFMAAGRGLAAAHAKDLVHRDFKPRNVLRHKDGRIVVTDFGLVVGVGDGAATTMRLSQQHRADDADTPSSLSDLTATGSVLGTPAYMAPEQWTGDSIGPATDQFAFCVALWEALAGERPYRGSTLDELKDEVSHAKRSDDSKIPRRYRKILARGLSPKSNDRYPNMDALLTAIARADRRLGPVFAIGGAAIAIGLALFLVVGRRESGPTCAAPVFDPSAVWTSKDAAVLGRHAEAFDRDMRAWRQLRANACKAGPGTRELQLSCLDGVLARLQTVKQASLKEAPNTDVGTLLLDPKICESARPPRLSHVASPELTLVMQRFLRRATYLSKTPTDEEIAATITDAGTDACAAALAHLHASVLRTGDARAREIDEADRAAQRCGDDRVTADVAMYDVQIAMAISAPDTRAKLKKAEAAVERVSQADLEADLEETRATLALKADKPDEAVKRMEHALKLHEERGG